MEILYKKMYTTNINRKIWNQIILLDKKNMNKIFQKAGICFNWNKRKEHFKKGDRIIVALDNRERVIGYIEYGFWWKQLNDLFIVSLQIDSKYQHTLLTANLLIQFWKDISNISFTRIICMIHQNNYIMLNLLKKLKFSFVNNKNRKMVFAIIKKEKLKSLAKNEYNNLIKKFLTKGETSG